MKEFAPQAIALRMVSPNPSASATLRKGTRPRATWTGIGSNRRRPMTSPVVKRSIVIAGHKTSVSLEDVFWQGLKQIANERDVTLSDLVASIDTDRHNGNLSSAIRLFVLDHYRERAGNTPRAPRSAGAAATAIQP
jgi:predicted DNA-binding ribbon-helix-helix protein